MGWGPSIPSGRQVDPPTPERLRAIARELEALNLTLLLLFELIDQKDAPAEAKDLLEKARVNADADQLHAWAEAMEQGTVTWSAAGS